MYGRDRELEVTLKRLRGQNNDILEEAAEIRVIVYFFLVFNFISQKPRSHELYIINFRFSRL